MNGMLTLRSTPGEGTEIDVRLLVRLDIEVHIPPAQSSSADDHLSWADVADGELTIRELPAAVAKVRVGCSNDAGCDDIAPPSEMLEQAERLLAMGALTDLHDWVKTLYQAHPQCRTFALLSQTLVEAGDLDTLRWLVGRNRDMPIAAGFDEVE